MIYQQGETDMTNTAFQCIGDDLRGYSVEPKYAGTHQNQVWIVPGSYMEDPMARTNGAIERAKAYVRRWWPNNTFKVE